MHIGQSKTGTTALQSFLATHRDSLEEKGFLYPDVFQNGVALKVENHNPLAEALCGMIRYPNLSAEEYFQQFSTQAAKTGCDTLLLSAESFWGAPQIWRLPAGISYEQAHMQKLAALRKQLNVLGCPVHIIVYLRRQDAWLQSSVGQAIRYEGLLGASVYRDDRQFTDLMAPSMDYAAMLDLWEQTIQPAAITAIPYEQAQLLEADVVHDFLHRTGIEIETEVMPSTAESSEIHASLGRDYLRLKKILNRIPKSKTDERTIIGCLTALDRHCGSGKSFTLEPALKREIRARYATSNRLLAKKYGTAWDFFSPQNSADANSVPASVAENIAALMAFDEAWFSPGVRFQRVLNDLKALLRNRLPLLHILARRLLLWFHRKDINPTVAGKGI